MICLAGGWFSTQGLERIPCLQLIGEKSGKEIFEMKSGRRQSRLTLWKTWLRFQSLLTITVIIADNIIATHKTVPVETAAPPRT
jgi:hypothetical protein